MKMQISEIAKLTGVSVRTLHYYDEIELLSPSQINQAGYRFYDDNALERLQQILFFKELDFPLKEIAKILSHPNYDKCEALKRQKQLLIMKKERLQHLIDLVDENLKGDNTMSFKEFDISEIKKAKEKYSDEVKERWGDSDAYKESEERTSNYKESDWKRINDKSNEIMEAFTSLVGSDPKSNEAQNLVEEWQNYITDNFYECTNEILSALADMYICDERFKNNIDKFGKGTAEFMNKAIKYYCEK